MKINNHLACRRWRGLITAAADYRGLRARRRVERRRRFVPLEAQARVLKFIASEAKSPSDLLKIEEIQSALFTAAGVSDKALNHLKKSEQISSRNLFSDFS